MKPTVYATPYQMRPHRMDRREDEVLTLSVDWNAVLHEASDATISTSTWATSNSDAVAVSSSANSGGISTVTATMGNMGFAQVTNTMTMSDGQIRKQIIDICVKDQPV